MLLVAIYPDSVASRCSASLCFRCSFRICGRFSPGARCFLDECLPNSPNTALGRNDCYYKLSQKSCTIRTHVTFCKRQLARNISTQRSTGALTVPTACIRIPVELESSHAAHSRKLVRPHARLKPVHLLRGRSDRRLHDDLHQLDVREDVPRVQRAVERKQVPHLSAHPRLERGPVFRQLEPDGELPDVERDGQ